MVRVAFARAWTIPPCGEWSPVSFEWRVRAAAPRFIPNTAPIQDASGGDYTAFVVQAAQKSGRIEELREGRKPSDLTRIGSMSGVIRG